MTNNPLTAAEKGELLHHATLAIERHILNTSPSLKEKSFTFENKKIINSGGVHHEIDIFVTVDVAPGYKSIYIFECKNWSDAVGKNEIVGFIEKMNCTNAAHGYFIAKSFTKDAYAQAEKRLGLTLLVAKENEPGEMPLPQAFDFTQTNMVAVELDFLSGAPAENKPFLDLNLDNCEAIYYGQPCNLRPMIHSWSDQIMNADSMTFRSFDNPEGEYQFKTDGSLTFQPEELTINGKPVTEAKIRISYSIRLDRPAIASTFDIETRGRLTTYAPVSGPGGNEVTFHVVQGAPS